MNYPLKDWSKLPYGYKFGVKTWYGVKHIGIDKMAPTGTPVYAHDSGTARTVKTSIQGNAVHIIDSKGHLVRYMHLSKFGKTGAVKAGDIIGYVGNTGLSKGAHLHVDVSKGKVYVADFNNFLHPETYFATPVVKPAPKPVAKPVARVYTVVKGDSLWKIALKTRNTVWSLKKKNPQIKNINLIHVGQKINY